MEIVKALVTGQSQSVKYIVTSSEEVAPLDGHTYNLPENVYIHELWRAKYPEYVTYVSYR